MSELRSYQKSVVGWVFHLMFKYLKEPRFKPVIDAMKAATNDEEKQAAREAYEDYK